MFSIHFSYSRNTRTDEDNITPNTLANNVTSSDAEERSIVSRSLLTLSKSSVSLIMILSYVYILKCADKTYYTGVTSNLDKRIIEHQYGKHPDSYTYKKRPVELVFYAEFTDISLAIQSEKQIKKWSKAKKEALINNEFDKLPNLSKKKF